MGWIDHVGYETTKDKTKAFVTFFYLCYNVRNKERKGIYMTFSGVVDNPSASEKEMKNRQKSKSKKTKERIETCFGRNVRILRKKRRYTQIDLALKCNVHQHYISEIENGKRNVTLQAVEIIARALGVKPSELLL